MNRKKGLFITIFSFAGEEGIMEIQGTPAPRARVLKVLRFDGAFGAEGCGGGFAAMSINAASRRAAVSLFFFPWAVALHIFGNTSRHCFPPTGMQHHSLTYDSYRDPSPAAQYSGHMSSLFFEEIYCFFLKKCNLNTPPGKSIFSNIFRRSIFLFQRYHYFVIGIQLMFIQ